MTCQQMSVSSPHRLCCHLHFLPPLRLLARSTVGKHKYSCCQVKVDRDNKLTTKFTPCFPRVQYCDRGRFSQELCSRWPRRRLLCSGLGFACEALFRQQFRTLTWDGKLFIENQSFRQAKLQNSETNFLYFSADNFFNMLVCRLDLSSIMTCCQ